MKAVFIVIFLLFFTQTTVWAVENERRIEEEKREVLQQTELKIPEGEERLVFDYGGWLNFRFDDYHDDDNDSLARDTYDYDVSVDFRIWLKTILRPPVDASYENEHSLYVRLKDLHIQRRPDDTAGGSDHDGPHLDYAYLTLDIRPWWLQIGRHYFSVGRGISYSNVNDGVELFLLLQKWKFKTFASHTLPHEDNIDTSVPGYSKESDRFYYGLECKYLGIADQSLYGYFVVQRDHSEESPEDLAQDYSYDSEYIGLGAQGKITPTIHYWAEIIKETGRSRVYGTNEKRDIDAWAGVLGAAYDWEVYGHPSFSFEYAFGSGDPDRVSVTDTINGNTSGDDENFLYFGYVPAGYALSPRLSNLHFFKLGASIKPLEKHPLFKNCTLGIDYYRYYKDEPAGGIYDPDASESNDDIGSEIDLKIFWQVLSDVSCTLQYGHFEPGDAYPASTNDSEDYFSISMSVTF